MGVEYELKYAATPEIQATLELMLRRPKTRRMETTYYDTPDGALSARRIMLRQRMENDICICTVKVPLPDGSRGEWECRSKDLNRGIKKLCQLGAPTELLELTAQGLQRVCGARFVRRFGNITVEGTTIELALDRGELLGGDKRLPLCEVELELKEGDVAVVDGCGAFLSQAFKMAPEERSKFRRALALARGEEDGL